MAPVTVWADRFWLWTTENVVIGPPVRLDWELPRRMIGANEKTEAEQVPEEDESPPVQAPEMNDMTSVLMKDRNWTEDAGSVDSQLIGECEQHCCELADDNLTVLRIYLDVAELGLAVLSAYVDHRLRLR